VWDNRWVVDDEGSEPGGHGAEAHDVEKTMTLEEAKVAWGLVPQAAL
jgi:hypothetical protein